MKELQIKRTETDLHETSDLITTSRLPIKYANVNKSLPTLVRSDLMKLVQNLSLFLILKPVSRHPYLMAQITLLILHNKGNSIHIYIGKLIRREVFYIWSHVSTNVQETDSVECV